MRKAEKVVPKKCAIYTRKSSEEGLERDFNSLHAQREACEAYIESQKHEGWIVINRPYDDGGLSGGTMDRPALQQLMTDIGSGMVDIVVVYKVDRLTRALSDFAKMVEVFDEHDMSFVSVTQQFNTTSSMGRLTLNVLLSFAQFEREVTGERIRDKIAASKKKGMWMGGLVPLGYEAADRKLVINDDEAEKVRTLFRLYARLGCVTKLKSEADHLGLRTKIRQNSKGRVSGGMKFSRGHLYRILQNPVYIGKIVHKGETYDGEHVAIVDIDLWDLVRERLRSNRVSQRYRTTAKHPSLLAGILYNDNEGRFTPSHAVKNGKRYRYYVERTLITEGRTSCPDGMRIAAHEIERVVLEQIRALLETPRQLVDIADLIGEEATVIDHAIRVAGDVGIELNTANPCRVIEIIHLLILRIVLKDASVLLQISRHGLRQLLAIENRLYVSTTEEPYPFSIPITFRTRGQELRIVINGTDTDSTVATRDPALIKAVVRSQAWFDRLVSGEAKSIRDISRTDKIADRYIGQVLRLAFLAPDIKVAILDGRQPRHLSAQHLVKMKDLPMSWEGQHARLGFKRV